MVRSHPGPQKWRIRRVGDGARIHFIVGKMKIFTDDFTDFLKQTLICSWKGHQKGKWIEVYWALAHSAGYKARFCEVCHKELETTKEKTRNSIP